MLPVCILVIRRFHFQGYGKSIDAGDWWQAQRQEAALREVLRRATARLQGIVTDLDIDRVAE